MRRSMVEPGLRTPDVLAAILAKKEEEVARIDRAVVRAELSHAPSPRDFAGALRRSATVSLLAEVKRRSPSSGAIREGANPVAVARAYEEAGAAAVSVLTDRDYFGGSLDDLRAVRTAVDLPVLRKDFVIDAAQLEEARAAGADAALLIVSALDDRRLHDLAQAAGDLGLSALVEVHDEEEMERALAAGARIIGVNNRDLRTFVTDLAVTLRLASLAPPDVLLVGESGIASAEDVRRLGEAGVEAVLVGESLMRQEDLVAAARALVGQPRRHR